MTDITRYRGDTSADEIQIRSDETGAAVDITGFAFLLTVNESKDPTDATDQVFQITGTITDAANGKVEFAPNGTQANNVGKYFYDIQMTDASSRIRTIQKGRYTMLQDITKS